MSQPNNPERVHRRRVQARMTIQDVSHSNKSSSTRRKKKRHSFARDLRKFWRRIPAVLRLIVISLCFILFLTMTVAVTKNYLAQQEERRRLEAEAAERAQHPLVYADHIAYYATYFDLDPALVSAIILSESSFNPEAESRLGARGLMQLMPDTAEWIAHKLDEDDETYSFDNLYTPEVNIRYGSWYLGYLSRRFNGDPVKIVCAYHAGQGNVDAWLKNPAYSSDGKTLDKIPMENTATYCSRVLKARNVYRKYYFPVQEEPTIPSEGDYSDAPQA